MIYTNFDQFNQHFKQGMRVIALDFGAKKVGVAITDRLMTIANPHSIISSSSYSYISHELEKIIKENDPWGIVIGYPVEIDGKIGKSCHRTYAFANKIFASFQLPIFLSDERETTRDAQFFLSSLGIKRKKRDSVDDKIASCIILSDVIRKTNKF